MGLGLAAVNAVCPGEGSIAEAMPLPSGPAGMPEMGMPHLAVISRVPDCSVRLSSSSVFAATSARTPRHRSLRMRPRADCREAL
jgi:hypothetical protein